MAATHRASDSDSVTDKSQLIAANTLKSRLREMIEETGMRGMK